MTMKQHARRTKLMTLLSDGNSQEDSAITLNVAIRTVQRDLDYIRDHPTLYKKFVDAQLEPLLAKLDTDDFKQLKLKIETLVKLKLRLMPSKLETQQNITAQINKQSSEERGKALCLMLARYEEIFSNDPEKYYYDFIQCSRLRKCEHTAECEQSGRCVLPEFDEEKFNKSQKEAVDRLFFRQ